MVVPNRRGDMSSTGRSEPRSFSLQLMPYLTISAKPFLKILIPSFMTENL